MENSRRMEIKRHLPEAEINELLRETEDDRRLRRISLANNFYKNDIIPKAAEREGRLLVTGACWAKNWNDGRFDKIIPNFESGRSPKLDEDEMKE